MTKEEILITHLQNLRKEEYQKIALYLMKIDELNGDLNYPKLANLLVNIEKEGFELTNDYYFDEINEAIANKNYEVARIYFIITSEFEKNRKRKLATLTNYIKEKYNYMIANGYAAIILNLEENFYSAALEIIKGYSDLKVFTIETDKPKLIIKRHINAKINFHKTVRDAYSAYRNGNLKLAISKATDAIIHSDDFKRCAKLFRLLGNCYLRIGENYKGRIYHSISNNIYTAMNKKQTISQGKKLPNTELNHFEQLLNQTHEYFLIR